MLTTFFIFVYVLISTLFMGTMAILGSLVGPRGVLGHLVARAWGRGILMVSRIRVDVRGLEHIDLTQPYIYMPNHLSNFDIPVLLGYLPVQFRWLAKAELFKIPLFGFAMRRAGYISIDRSDRRSAFASLKKAAETIRNGVSVLIFPEGTRSLDGHLREFKKGGFVLAIDSQVPIVPVRIRGTWEIMPKDNWRIRPGRVVMEIMPPIPTTNYTRKAKNDLMHDVRRIISTPSKNTGK